MTDRPGNLSTPEGGDPRDNVLVRRRTPLPRHVPRAGAVTFQSKLRGLHGLYKNHKHNGLYVDIWCVLPTLGNSFRRTRSSEDANKRSPGSTSASVVDETGRGRLTEPADAPTKWWTTPGTILLTRQHMPNGQRNRILTLVCWTFFWVRLLCTCLFGLV